MMVVVVTVGGDSVGGYSAVDCGGGDCDGSGSDSCGGCEVNDGGGKAGDGSGGGVGDYWW